MRPLHRATVALIALCGLACHGTDPTGTTPRVEVTADAVQYVAQEVPGSEPRTRYAFNVVVRTTNRSAQPISLSRCGSRNGLLMFSVQLHTGSAGAQSAFNPIWACAGPSAAIWIYPGATRIDTLTVTGPNAFDGVTGEPIGVVEGLMSLNLSGPESNRFSVVRAP